MLLDATKWIGLLIAGSVVFSIIIGILSGIMTYATTGNYRPLVDSTAGIMFNSDQIALSAVHELSNDTSMKENPEKFSDIYVDFLKQRILTSIAVTCFVIFLAWMLLRKLSGQQQFEFTSSMLFLFVAILMVGLLQVVYTIVEHGIVVVPFQGVLSTLFNLRVFFVVPQSVTQVSTGIGWQVMNVTA